MWFWIRLIDRTSLPPYVGNVYMTGWGKRASELYYRPLAVLSRGPGGSAPGET